MALEDGLVADDNQVDQTPLTPLDNVGDLLLGTSDTSVGNEDTNDHMQAGGLASIANVLETIAVGGVDANNLEALASNDFNIGHHLTSALALTAIGVWRVGHTPGRATTELGGLGRSLGGLSNWLLGRCRSWLWLRADGFFLWTFHWLLNWLLDRLGDWLFDLGGVSTGWLRADVDIVGFSYGDGRSGLGVGTRSVGGWGRIDNDGALEDGGGGWRNGVSSLGWAYIRGGLDDAGVGVSNGLDGRDGAGHGGRFLHDRGHTAVGVRAWVDRSGRGTADGGLLGDDDGGGLDGVGARGWVDGDDGRWEHVGIRGSDGHSHGGVAGGAQGGGALGDRLRHHYHNMLVTVLVSPNNQPNIVSLEVNRKHLRCGSPVMVMVLTLQPQFCSLRRWRFA